MAPSVYSRGSLAPPMPPSTPDSPITERTHPPRPRLAFRVGVVGHRLKRLNEAGATEPALALKFAEILKTVDQAVRKHATEFRAWYTEELPELRLLSPLAEGIDRWMARCALRQGWAIAGVFPFPQAEYEHDFQGDSLGAFRDLIREASAGPGWTRFELDGDRSDSATAYGTAGRVLLNQTDLLIAVWDGHLLGKAGGTEETMVDALRRGIPVIWVDAHAPHDFALLTGTQRLPKPAQLDWSL